MHKGQRFFTTVLRHVNGLAIAATLLLGAVMMPAADNNRFFEMRIYTSHPGKLADLNTRFRDHTNRLFVKHGMTLIGYWTPTEGPEAENTLIYILAYPSREARDASWKAFRADPEWIKASTESEKNGKIVEKVESKFMTPTDYSPIK